MYIVTWYLDISLLKHNFQLLDPVLALLVATLEGLDATSKLCQLLLHRYNCLITFIKSRGEPDHDISLLEQQMLVSLYMHLIVL